MFRKIRQGGMMKQKTIESKRTDFKLTCSQCKSSQWHLISVKINHINKWVCTKCLDSINTHHK
jgi:ribosomal protein L37AE/L43A